MINNSFIGNANYSTREQPIGIWKDGRTIYRKVVEYTPNIQLSGSGQEILVPHNITNLREVVHCVMQGYRPSDGKSYSFPYIKGDKIILSELLVY